MKYGLLFFLALTGCLCCSALYGQKWGCPGQKCRKYTDFMDKGAALLKINSLDLALIEFQAAQVAARVCDCPTEEPAKYIKQVFDGIKEQRDEAIKQKNIAQEERKKTERAIASLYVNHAGALMNKEDVRPAWRLVEKALAKDKNNAEARKLSAAIPEYGSRYFLDGIGEEVVVSPDSNYCYFFTKEADGDTTLNLFDLGENKLLDSFHKVYIYNNYRSSANEKYNYFSPDSRYLFFFTPDTNGNHILNLFDLQRQQIIYKSDRLFKEKYRGDSRCCFSPDSRYLLFFTRNKYNISDLNLLDLQENARNNLIENCDDYYYDCFSPDSKYLLYSKNQYGAGNHTTILNLADKSIEKIFPYSTNNGYTMPFVFSPDSRHIIFFKQGSDNSFVLNLQQLGAETKPDTFPGVHYRNSGGDDYFSFSPDGRYLAFFTGETSQNLTLKLLDIYTKNIICSYQDCSNENYKFSPDSRRFVFFENCKNDTSTLTLVDLPSHKFIFQYNRTYCDNYNSGFSPDGNYLIFYSKSRYYAEDSLNLIGLGDGISHRIFHKVEISNHVHNYLFSPDSRFLVFLIRGKAFSEPAMCLLDLDGNIIRDTFFDLYHYNYTYSDHKAIRFSNNSRYLTFTNKNNVLNVVDTYTLVSGKYKLNSFNIVNWYLYGISPDNKYLAFTDTDTKSLTVIDMQNWTTSCKLKHRYFVGGIFFLNYKCILTSSEYPETRRKIYKIISPYTDSGHWENYLESYAPLSKEEKLRYGVID